jgi:tetratricopeptide (TPR) repeat protein
MRRVVGLLLAGALAAATFTSRVGASHDAGADPKLDQTLEAAFNAAYNLDHADASRLARLAVAHAPGDAQTHRALATVLWLELLFRQGALTLDYQLAGLAKSPHARVAAPSELDAAIKQSMARATALADARLQRAPDSVEAKFEYGAVNALQASYVASVEGSATSAFGAARRAYDAHEQVIESNPSHAPATVVVGSYRYLVSGMRLPGRLVAYLAGFGGGKERGIAMLEAARRDPLARIEAATALLLIYTREGRHLDALDAARELARRFPRNRLFALEVGAAALRAGRMDDADAALTRALAAYAADPRPKMPGELALLRYKRGLARLRQNLIDDAGADFRAALAAAPPGWIEGRVRLEIGRIASIRGALPEAAAEFGRARQACTATEDRLCAAEASRQLRAARNRGE